MGSNVKYLLGMICEKFVIFNFEAGLFELYVCK
jgi:hypothetical protein